VASFGEFGGIHYQNQADVGPYMTALENNELPVYRAYPTSHEERFIREFILQLKLGRLEVKAIRKKYGIDPLARYQKEIGELEAEGFLAVEGDGITLRREGLLQVDRLLHRFFLTSHRDARYT
jgi:oxygen-independent coproporphyrinogen-3 oxidase